MNLEAFGLKPTKAKFVSLGDVFDRLTVVAVGEKGRYRYFAVCQCACGAPLKAIRSDHLTSGRVLSCGCVQQERSTKHGLSSSAHYDRWRHMLSRCEDPSDAAYADYGGRGIRVCAEWHDLEVFVRELPTGYRPGLEIDRIDNDGDYERGNVRWATRSQNADNRRSARLLTHDGRTQSLRCWSKETGINEGTLWQRVVTWGWDHAKALTTAPMTSRERMAKAHEARWAGHIKKAAPTPKPPLKRFPLDGEMLTIAELADRTGISKDLLRKRLVERGWPPEKALVR